MNINQAIEQLINGQKIRQVKAPPYEYLFIEDGVIKQFSCHCDELGISDTLLISNGWLVEDDKIKKYSFIEAFKEMKSGKIIRLDTWPQSSYLCLKDGQMLKYALFGVHFYTISVQWLVDQINNEQWEIYQEKN